MLNNKVNENNPKDLRKHKLIAFAIIITAIAYAIHYFNYMATPTEDFISNFRQKVLDIYSGKYPDGTYNIMPVFPIVLAFLSKINPFSFSHDLIYDTAILLNILLFIPYIFLVYQIFRKFIDSQYALAALLFLSVNINNIYTAINAELEMLMTLLIVFALWLSIRESKFSYIPAFLASGIKYDSVFIIPAVMFRDFFFKRQRIITIILGALSSAGICMWVIFSILFGNSYISEIASRGPNIYMFLVDCILTATGFVPWMAMHGYESQTYYIKIPLFFLSALFLFFILIILIKGIIFIIRQRWNEISPIIIFFSGFVIIHMIYQNTKSRYVLPILCIIYLFMFYGLSNLSYTSDKLLFFNISPNTKIILMRMFFVMTVILYFISSVIIIFNLPIILFFFALIFSCIFGIIVFTGKKKWKSIRKIFLILTGGIIINFSIFYGVRTMDHYSYRRVEFKEAALWFKANSGKNDRMLISITDMPIYYTKLPQERFISAVQLKSLTLDNLIKELRSEKVTHVFVDDFYIRRYRIKDPNSIEKKAWLFKAIKENGEASKHFKLLNKFEPRPGIISYMYRFIP